MNKTERDWLYVETRYRLVCRSYHKAWLKAHRNRTEGWLKHQLRDGFEVHHRDGDKTNNHSNNLILIEGRDHDMLHMGWRPARS